MGVADLFGFSKKENKPPKTPFKIPGEVLAVRARIEDANRENYPDLVRYQGLVKNVNAVFALLDSIIARAVYAEEAGRVREDLRRKMMQLTEKISKNRGAALKTHSNGYVESNMEYLERKGMRIQAKTLFTECLDSMESIMKYYTDGHVEHGATIESITRELLGKISALNNDYFKEHGDDKEIQEIREALLVKIQGLSEFFDKNRERLKEIKVETKARATLSAIIRESKSIFGI